MRAAAAFVPAWTPVRTDRLKFVPSPRMLVPGRCMVRRFFAPLMQFARLLFTCQSCKRFAQVPGPVQTWFGVVFQFSENDPSGVEVTQVSSRMLSTDWKFPVAESSERKRTPSVFPAWALSAPLGTAR